MLPETKKEDAHMIGERIRKTIERHAIQAYDETTHITISIGISSYPKDSDTKNGLMQKADKALYEAKRSGRNKVI